ncbi:response regulator [Corallococcus llansteffanensis]|uniref:DNA-binding response regulator n=1 Tax=Corallococcus llansteffanensis TaxID=2316731 RepID=A0A3A8QAT6_9BACT|nr:response regulator transcription factor [Corallococcus llansteffanensis]RKH64691.1 DNA-binding response regulator [Corallococcus llansteffanensis]
MIRVVLVDDQTLLRKGLRSLLELATDILVVGEATDGQEAVGLIRALTPDVVLLDVRMPRLDGPGVLEALGGHAPPTLLLTTFDDEGALLRGMRAGARGFLLKDVSFEDLCEAIRRIARGETLLRPTVTEAASRNLEALPMSFERSEQPEALTPREREVLRLMAGGFSNKEIADALGTREGTAKNHASSIFAKLGVRDRTRAVLRALELGMI